MRFTIFENFQIFCENQLGDFFSSKSTKMCIMLNKVLKLAIEYFEEEYIETDEICNLSVFKHCNLTPIETGNDNCTSCKLIAKQLKMMSFDITFNQYVGKYLPHITYLIISHYCSESAECNYLDINQIIKGLILFETEEDDFSSVLCSNIGLCN